MTNSQPHSDRNQNRAASRWWTLAMMLLVTSTGCQTLHPFAQRTKEKILSARQWANGGLEAFQCGRLQQAKGFFTRATEQSPGDFRVRANLARTLHQSGDGSEAIRQMQQAVDQSGGDPGMIVELGEMYLASGQLAPAVRQVQTALASDHRNAAAWHLQGRINRSRNDYAQALIDFQKAAGYAPERLDIQMDIVRTYRLKNQPQKALAAVEYLLSQHPSDSQPEQAILIKSDVLFELNQLPTAVAFLKSSIQTKPSASTIKQLAIAQMKAGQWSDARLTIALGRSNFPKSKFDQVAQLLDQRQQDSPTHMVAR